VRPPAAYRVAGRRRNRAHGRHHRGAALGAIVAPASGRQLDKGDEACIGHASNLRRPGEAVRWTSAGTGTSYVLVPAKTVGADCREFKLEASAPEKKSWGTKVAARSGWRLEIAGLAAYPAAFCAGFRLLSLIMRGHSTGVTPCLCPHVLPWQTHDSGRIFKAKRTAAACARAGLGVLPVA